MYRKWWVKALKSKAYVVRTLRGYNLYTLINLQQRKDKNGAIFHLNLFGN